MRYFFGILIIFFSASCTLVYAATGTEGQITALQARIVNGLHPTGRQQFVQVQNAWKRYRDAECKYRQANYSIMTSEAECIKGLNESHLKQLKTQLDWLSGPASDGGNIGETCRSEIGAKRADRMVRHCLAVSTATRPPCNAQNTCKMISSEIKRSCKIIGHNAPTFCRDYR